MKYRKIIAGLLVSTAALVAQISFAQTTETAAQTLDFELYGSLRMHVNYASVDASIDGEDNSFFGLTDAYSRVGAKASYGNEDITVTARFEVNVNSADLELGDPSFFDDEDERLYSVTAKGKFGTVTVGKDWLPYYNNIGYPVDNFSSIYAGYTTYAYFRERQITYISPSYGGVTGSLARIERTGGGPKGWHYVLSYSGDKVTLAAGREDMDGDIADTQGAAISYKDGPFYSAVKYEKSDAFGDIFNAYGQITQDKLTYKVGVGFGDQFSGDTYHIGVDYQLNKDLKVFSEFYSEEKNYAILKDGAVRASDYFGAGGFGARQDGKVLLAGFRFDFSTD